MSDRILITGASGFIGYHLVKAATERGFEVHTAVRESSDVSRLNALNPVFIYPDFSSKDSLEKLIGEGEYDYIIHAAGATRAKNEAQYNLVNADYTRNLGEAAVGASKTVKRFVLMSSLAALGPVPYDHESPITEETIPAPVTAYGRSKLLAEKYLHDLKGLKLTVVRPTAVYGPWEKDILIMFKALASGVDAYIGKSPQWFSFVYVEDLVNVTLTAMLEEANGHKVYNVSDGSSYDRYALADEFKRLSGSNAVRVHLPLTMLKATASVLEFYHGYRKTTPVINREKLNELTAPNWRCSIGAAQRDLHYIPQYDLHLGLEKTLKWYREKKWL